MKVYLVGGAVRDELLGYPVKEKDWVIVGAKAEELKHQGYLQVGKDFPVFLHPQTREEYALARKEKKSSPGYHGFTCDFDPSITLEEDLARRDLTINAIAKSDSGEIIDPFNGQDDLKHKFLRHVSPAFLEDPVRVLRVARFAARYHHLGFKVHPETRRLMYRMVKNGELNHLVPERVWQEWQISLTEKNPEIFIAVLRSCDALKVILPELEHLFGVPNPKKYHPEVDSGVHTLMVLQAAAGFSPDAKIRFAALVHDLGKGITPMNIWPSHYGHDKAGAAVIRELSDRLRIPTEYRKFAEMVSKFHLLIHQLSELKPNTIVEILEKADAFRRPQTFKEMLLVCKSDHFGKGKEKNIYAQEEAWKKLLDVCSTITAEELVKKGLKGEQIRLGLHQLRVEQVKKILDHK